MAQAKLREMDLAPTPALSDREGVKPVGSITITFHEVEGHVIPEVSFAPLGRINPNTIERCLPFIYQQIQRQQVADRRSTSSNASERSDEGEPNE